VNASQLLPLALIASSLIPALLIFLLPEHRSGWRTTLNLFAALTKLALVGLLLAGVNAGKDYGFAFEALPGVALEFRADELGPAVHQPFGHSLAADNGLCHRLSRGFAASQPFLRILQPLRDRDHGHRDGRQPVYLLRVL
jgi:hypothetical protein